MRNWHPMYDAAYPPITEVTGGLPAWWDEDITPSDYGITTVDGQTRVVLPPVTNEHLTAALDLIAKQQGKLDDGRRVYAGDVSEATARVLRTWLTYQKHGCDEASALEGRLDHASPGFGIGICGPQFAVEDDPWSVGCGGWPAQEQGDTTL